MAIAALMPTTSPLRFTSGPPELPGLIAASVWIASNTAVLVAAVLSPVSTGRAVLLTMPEVTVFDRPSGAPTATTVCPTCKRRWTRRSRPW